MNAVLVYSATLLNAPWTQTAAAMQATQTALAADLLHCDVVGAFTAGVVGNAEFCQAWRPEARQPTQLCCVLCPATLLCRQQSLNGSRRDNM